MLMAHSLIMPLFVLFFAFADSRTQVGYFNETVALGEIRWKVISIIAVYGAAAVYLGFGLWYGKSLARHIFFSFYVTVGLVGTFIDERYGFCSLSLPSLRGIFMPSATSSISLAAPNNALHLPPEPFAARFLSRLLQPLPQLHSRQPRQILGAFSLDLRQHN